MLDIDECMMGNYGCEDNCVNNDGGFMCSCNLGYILNDDGKICDGKYVIDVVF